MSSVRDIRVASSIERPKAFLLLPPFSRINMNKENHLRAIAYLRALPGASQRDDVEIYPPCTDYTKARDYRTVIEFPTMAQLELFLLTF